MDASATKISFSIDHILGTEVGPPTPVDAESWYNVGCSPFGLRQGLSNGLGNLNLRGMPRPLTTINTVPAPVMAHTFDYNSIYLHGYGSYNYHHYHHHHHHNLTHHPSADVGLGIRTGFNNERGYHVLPHLRQAVSQRPRGRMRTVFTDSQTRCLEQQFELTDYPSVETRAELARTTGLTDETVKVWYKNRRARRKRQKVTSPSSELEDGPFLVPLSRAR